MEHSHQRRRGRPIRTRLGVRLCLGSLTLSPTNQLTIGFANLGNASGVNYRGGTDYQQACGPSQAIVGYNGRVGIWLDQIQPICATLVVNYKS